jgi:Ca2+-binding RTX toxin-like protein
MLRFLGDPTDDGRPNVRGTDDADVLGPMFGGGSAVAGQDGPAGLPDGASIFNAGGGDDTVTGSDGADTVLSGDGDDTVRAGGGDDASVEGEAGDDALWGGDGQDVLFGRTGDDLLWGESGDDYLEGGRGADGLSGGDGNDSLYGGFDRDRLQGGAGDDRISAYDGVADLVDCGSGFDTAEVDRRDIVRNCERTTGPNDIKQSRDARKRRR